MLHQNATSNALQFFRTYVWLLWLYAVAVLPLTELSTLPTEVYRATGAMQWLGGPIQHLLVSSTGLAFLKWIAVVLILATLFKPRRFLFPVIACILITFIECQVRAFSHINHAEIGLLLAIYVLTSFEIHNEFLCNAPSHATSESPEVSQSRASLTTIAFLFCLTYSFIGLCRLGDGGPVIFASGSMTTWHEVATMSPRCFDLSIGESMMSHPGFATLIELGYPLITAIEILAPLCLLSIWFRRLFLAVMIPFHIMTVILMGILFWENVALYILFIDISTMLEKLKIRVGSQPILSPKILLTANS